MMTSAHRRGEVVLALDIGSGACKGSLVMLPPELPTDTAIGGGAHTSAASTSIPTVMYGREATSLLGHAVAAAATTTSAAASTSSAADVHRRVASIPPHAVDQLFRALTDIFSEAEEVFHTFIGCRTCNHRSTAANPIDNKLQQEALYTVPRVAGCLPSLLETSHAQAQSAWKAVPKFGICTAVFRNTINGQEVLRSVQDYFHCALRIASQQQEGVLGYRTGIQALLASMLHALPRSPGGARNMSDAGDARGGSIGRNVVVWDSGGASFQLTTYLRVAPNRLGRHDRATDDSNKALLAAFEGNWGSSQAVHAVVSRVQGRCFPTESANPMSHAHAEAAIRLIMNDLLEGASTAAVSAVKHTSTRMDRSDDGGGGGGGRTTTTMSASEMQQLLQRQVSNPTTPCSDGADNDEVPVVIGIGGPTCAFRMCALLCHPEPDITTSRLRARLASCILGKTDDAIQRLGFPQEAMVGPKVCLVLAVMEFMGMASFRYLPTIGSTLGIVASRDELIGKAHDDAMGRGGPVGGGSPSSAEENVRSCRVRSML